MYSILRSILYMYIHVTYYGLLESSHNGGREWAASLYENYETVRRW